MRNEKNDWIDELLNYGFIILRSLYYPIKNINTNKKMKGFEMLIDILKKTPSTAQAEEIQTEIYNIGMSEFKSTGWFSGL